MNEENLLTVYAISHDCTVTFINKNKQLTTIEFDRWANTKHNRTQKQLYFPERLTEEKGLVPFFKYIITQLPSPDIIKKIIFCIHKVNIYGDYTITRKRMPERSGLPKKYGYDPYMVDTLKELVTEQFSKAKIIFKPSHHYAHAACGYYQAPKHFEESLIFSYDGTGFTTFQSKTEPENVDQLKKLKGLPFNTGILFYAKHFNKKYGIKYVKTFKPTRYGGPYTLISTKLKIRYPDGSIDFISKPKSNRRLSAPGKFMGYTGYGTPDEQLVKFYKDWYTCARVKNIPKYEKHMDEIHPDDATSHAASAQAALEEVIIELLWPILKKKRIPLIITGGCALNVLVNQKLAKKCKEELGIDVFICNNPNDSGISQGMFLLEFPKNRQNLTYNGIPIMDKHLLDRYVKRYNVTKESSIPDLVKVIKHGKIIGCVHDNSELGPRALGNRSILCKPDPGMKDILNAKIKFREWFRPFAPVCRLEDKDKYFDDAFESQFMSFAPTVKLEYRNILKSITHIDNTARLQTVTKEQHKFLYDVLCEMEVQGMIPVILNTSFNIRGKPILTRYSSAIEALETTQLDYVFLDKKYLINNPNEK